MTDEELNKMIGEFLPYPAEGQHYALKQFATLVAAAEREKVAQWMMQKGYATGHGETTEDLLAELDWQIAESWTKSLVKGVEGEREACAKLCDDLDDDLPDGLAGWQYGEAIRARGNND